MLIASRRGGCGSSHLHPSGANMGRRRGTRFLRKRVARPQSWRMSQRQRLRDTRRSQARLLPLGLRPRWSDAPPGISANADSISVGSLVGAVTSSVLPSKRHIHRICPPAPVLHCPQKQCRESCGAESAASVVVMADAWCGRARRRARRQRRCSQQAQAKHRRGQQGLRQQGHLRLAI